MNTIINPNETQLIILDNTPLDQNPAGAYLAGLNKKARRVQEQALRVIAGILGFSNAISCPWPSVRFQHAVLIRAELAARYKPQTANRMLAALRGTLKAAFNLGQLSAEDLQRAISIKSVTGTTLPAGRSLGSGEIVALMADCENDITPAGARDAAIIGLLYACGLRRAEVVGLDLESWDPESGVLKVFGKRSKERLVYPVNGARAALEDWLSIRGSAEGALFCAINKGGHLAGQRMTDQAIYNMLKKRGKAAGLQNFSPHDFRRTCAGDLLDAGADIVTVQKLLGHSSPTTTARYDRRPEEVKRKAAELLHVPYRGRLVR